MKTKTWYDKNKKISNLRAKQWRLDNPIASREANKRYRDKHRQWYIDYCKQWRRDNPDKVKALSKRQYQILVSTEEGRAKHAQNQWDYRNKDEESLNNYREYQREYHRKYRAKKRAEKVDG